MDHDLVVLLTQPAIDSLLHKLFVYDPVDDAWIPRLRRVAGEEMRRMVKESL